MSNVILLILVFFSLSVFASDKEINPFMELSKDDKQFVSSLIPQSIYSPNYIDSNVKKRFSQIMQKAGISSEEEISSIKTMMISLLKYHTSYWEDALISLKKKNSYKSVQRRELGEYLIKLSVLTNEQIDLNDSKMDLIARGKPMLHKDKEVVFDELVINKIIVQLSDCKEKVGWLFTANDGNKKELKCSSESPRDCVDIAKNLEKKDKPKEEYMRFYTDACKFKLWTGCLLASVKYYEAGDLSKSIEYAKTGCELKGSFACSQFANLSKKTLSSDEAHSFYIKSCDYEMPDGNGCFHVADYLRQKNSSDYSRYLKYYEKACELKVPEACRAAGLTYYLMKNYEKMRDFLSTGCAFGDNDSCLIQKKLSQSQN